MATNGNSGRVTADISGNVETTGVELLILNNFGLSTATMGTVGAGKKWRVYGWALQAHNQTSTSNTVALSLGGKQVAKVLYQSQVALGSNYIELASGETIVKTNGAAINTDATVWYEELDA